MLFRWLSLTRCGSRTVLNNFLINLRLIENNLDLNSTAEECFSDFMDKFKKSYDDCFIKSNKNNSGCKNRQILRKDWITIGLAKSCARKQFLYENFKANSTKSNWDSYTEYSRILDRFKTKLNMIIMPENLMRIMTI